MKTSAARAGCVSGTWQQVMLEWPRDWAHRETYDAVIMASVKEHSGAYGMGVDYAYAMVHKSKERVKHGPLLEPVSAGKSKHRLLRPPMTWHPRVPWAARAG